MKNSEAPAKRRPGRPRSFDRETALHRAMLLFWRHGYEATSLNDLTEAMHITPPSLYTAFGDKKQLFLESVRRYTSGPVTSTSIIEGAATARKAAEDLLTASAVGFTGEDTPAGCLLATSAISCSAASADVQKVLSDIRIGVETHLQRRIERDNATLRAGRQVNAEAMAAFVVAMIQGMSTLARDGASRAKLMTVVETAMQAWPSGHAATRSLRPDSE